ncbi:MAG TPA: FAD-dependent oxidoreductase [Gemmatimonadales bacterium]|nr:FAD-dependent oxidoreductase [Gemmatimonadales bacterium]
MTCVVVGAGLTGLSAAWELTRAGGEVIVLESERRAGGVVVTERQDGFLVEGGPDGFLAADGDIQALARELGLGDRLVDQRAKGAMVWTGKRLEPLPLGRAAELLGIEGASGVGAQHAAPLQGGFRSFAGGMAEISDALTARLHAAIRTAQGVTGIAPSRRGWRLAVTGGSQVEAEGVILAVPAWVAARLLATVGLPGARDLDYVVYSPSITVSLAYRTDQLKGRLDGTGFVSAPQLDGPVRACTYAWLKYPGRAPPGFALLRAFLGPVDGDPAALAHRELATRLSLSGSPVWSRAFHWRRGLPRYKPGQAERVAHVRNQLGRLAPLDLAGAGFDGAGVSACVKSGREAARRVVTRLSSVRG